MPLTRDFKDTVRARAETDAAFRGALLAEAVELLLDGDVDAGKLALRNCINATLGFEALAEATGKPVKSLMRMFGPSGNPTAGNMFSVIKQLQAATDVHLAVEAA